MKQLLNRMALEAEMAAKRRANTRIGTISAYNPNDYCAKVTIQPEGMETGWLPITSEWVGNGWGLFCPPTIGDQVEVEFQESNFEAGIIVKRLFNDKDRPLAVQSGEFWLVHQTGSRLKFHNDGSVEVASHTNMTATVGGNLTANVTGSATITAHGGITQDGAGAGATKGCVQGDCVCAFTGQPHPMISGTVKASV